MTETLQVCPFCGKDNAWHDSDGVVICADCGAMGPEIASIHRDDNAAAWNRRAEPTPEALEAWAEWFDRHPEIGVVIVIAGDAYSHGTPGYLLREIARRLRAAREE